MIGGPSAFWQDWDGGGASNGPGHVCAKMKNRLFALSPLFFASRTLCCYSLLKPRRVMDAGPFPFISLYDLHMCSSFLYPHLNLILFTHLSLFYLNTNLNVKHWTMQNNFSIPCSSHRAVQRLWEVCDFHRWSTSAVTDRTSAKMIQSTWPTVERKINEKACYDDGGGQ